MVDGSSYILFVDDEEITRKTFERIASQEFSVLLAGDVAEAIDILKQRGNEIGVLLTDQRMPGGLGVELLEYARENNPDIVRMLTTAYSDLEDAIAAVNRGEIIRYIEKPWNNIDALLIDLRVAMQLYQLERANTVLLAEKLSAKAQGSKIERVQVLAAIAAIQPNPEIALIALEDMLKAISDLHRMNKPGLEVQVLLETGPIKEAENAILFAKRVCASIGIDDWGSGCNISLSEGLSDQQFEEMSPSKMPELMARLIALFNQNAGVSARLSNGNLNFSVKALEAGSIEIPRWLNVGSDDKSINALADLFCVYLILYASNAKVDIVFGDTGELNQINIEFLTEGAAHNRKQDADWLEDILILLS